MRALDARPDGLGVLGTSRIVRDALLPWQLPWIANGGDFWDGLSGITIAGSGVSDWKSLIQARSFTQGTDANRPTYANGIITGNNVDQWLDTGAMTLNAPFVVIECVDVTDWASNRWLFNGRSASIGPQQATASPQFQLNDGTLTAAINGNLPLDTFGIMAFGANGASSFIRVNNTTKTTGTVNGTINTAGLVWNAFDTAGAAPAGKRSKGIALINGTVTDAQLDQTIAAMARRYGVPL